MVGFGYPLDDAWIHQTYARNLVEHGEWSFIPGKPSGGSTAPIWSGVLSIGPLLGIDHRIWTYFVGVVLLVSLGWLSMKWFTNRWGEQPGWVWVIGAVIVLEWHLLWAALSGMEILAFSLLCLCFFYLVERKGVSPILLGLLIGFGVWIRPGALTLLLPGLLALFFYREGNCLVNFGRFSLGIALALVPYLLFNTLLTGTIWPNTFYAKQAEYLELNQRSLFLRFLFQAYQPLVGIGSLLLPGIIMNSIRDLRRREFRKLLPLVWVVAYLGMYALRLPVTYQHGRYVMPTIPILMIIGLEGLGRWVEVNSSQASKRILSRIWLISAMVVLIAFVLLGGNAYGRDVAIIETEMVATARWIDDNTEEQALIAAHDIGALGYFGHRDLLDLAGLISPEVIPFIRDEEKLSEYLDERSADYLMTFPEWYPELVQGRSPIYVTKGEFSPAAGGENMTVYAWGY
jgi:hypothetical protein